MAAKEELAKAINFLKPTTPVAPIQKAQEIQTYQPEIITPQGIAEAQIMYGQSTPPPAVVPPAPKGKGWGKV